MSVPESLAGGAEACPSCGNVATVPSVRRRPRVFVVLATAAIIVMSADPLFPKRYTLPHMPRSIWRFFQETSGTFHTPFAGSNSAVN